MIGIIGGSGFYEFIDNPEKREIKTPFGKVIVDLGKVNDVDVVFIPRHGSSHSILPSEINYRANIYAAYLLKVDRIYATNAVGSLIKNNTPGTFAVPDQILDFTNSRKSTFFEGTDFEVITKSGKKLSGVVHTDVSTPFDTEVRNDLINICKKIGVDVIEKGTIVVVNGPRYETPAEINAYRTLGADFAGMTSSPEAFLAKELEIQYATLALITNFAAGMQKSISHKEVETLFKERMVTIQKIFYDLISA